MPTSDDQIKEQQWRRPHADEILTAYNHIFTEHNSPDKLRDSVINGHLFPASKYDDGVPGRSIAWKLFLAPREPLTVNTVESILDYFRDQRSEYAKRLKEDLGPLEEMDDGLASASLRANGFFSGTQEVGQTLETNNPLSLDESNPWHTYYSHMQLKRTITLDITRLFPDIPYFRSEKIHRELTNILFLWATSGKEGEDAQRTGYRQGMHELAGAIWSVVDFDSLEGGGWGMAGELCDRSQVAADSYALISLLLSKPGILPFYEWRAPPPSPAPVSAPLPSVHPANYVPPIVGMCELMIGQRLKAVDPTLVAALEKGGIEGGIFGVRWLRLLFSREFDMPDALALWDGIFATYSPDSTGEPRGPESMTDLCVWVGVAMLIRIRNLLIPSDNSTQITYLLRYPLPSALVPIPSTALPEETSADTATSSSSPTSPKIETNWTEITTTQDSNTLLLVRQALLLCSSPIVATGAQIVYENKRALGIPTDVPKSRRPLSSPPGGGRGRRGRGRGRGIVKPESPRATSRDGPGLQDFIVKNVMERGETVLGAISEMRRSLPIQIPDISHLRYPSYPANYRDTDALDDFPLPKSRNNGVMTVNHKSTNSLGATTRPPWEPKSRFEIEREMSELRSTMRVLGAGMGRALDVLLRSYPSTSATTEDSNVDDGATREALECLDYVRECLSQGGLGIGSGGIDEERLFGETEWKRMKQAAQEKSRAAEVQSTRDAGGRASGSSPPVATTTAPTLVASSSTTMTKDKPVVTLPVMTTSTGVALPPRDASLKVKTRIDTNLQRPTSNSSRSQLPSSSAVEEAIPTTKNQPKPPWQYSASNFTAPTIAPLPTARASRGSSFGNVRNSHEEGQAKRDTIKKDPLGVLP